MAANGESHGKKADPEVQKDVEEMMLDYFLYKATEALLTERQAMRDASVPSTMEADMQLNMVDCAFPHLPTTCTGQTRGKRYGNKNQG